MSPVTVTLPEAVVFPATEKFPVTAGISTPAFPVVIRAVPPLSWIISLLPSPVAGFMIKSASYCFTSILVRCYL